MKVEERKQKSEKDKKMMKMMRMIEDDEQKFEQNDLQTEAN